MQQYESPGEKFVKTCVILLVFAGLLTLVKSCVRSERNENRKTEAEMIERGYSKGQRQKYWEDKDAYESDRMGR